MCDLEDLFAALAQSSFRRKFRLQGKDLAYLQEKGMPLVLAHAADFITTRLAPAHIANDGKQTPMRGHPVFVAQHATATCCRSCLEKWHKIHRDHALNEAEQAYVLRVLAHWLEQAQVDTKPVEPAKLPPHSGQLDIFQ